MHPIDDTQIIQYIDGALSPAEAGEFERHLGGCRPCRDLLSQVRADNAMLRYGFREACDAVKPADDEVSDLLAATLQRLRQGAESPSLEAAPPASPALPMSEAIAALLSVLEPICGSGTVERWMELAAFKASGNGLDEMVPAHWKEVVLFLSGTVAAVCGTSTAHVVDEAARRFEAIQ